MTIMSNKKSYDFETYVPNILGTAFKQVQILGYFPYETAIALFGEIDPLHAEIFSTGRLPVGTPDDPRQYNYYRIKKQDGSITVIGEPWIDQASIVEVTSGTATVILPKVTTTDMIRLRDTLKQSGFVDFQISFSS